MLCYLSLSMIIVTLLPLHPLPLIITTTISCLPFILILSIPILVCLVFIATIGTNIKSVTTLWITNSLSVLILSMPIIVKSPVYLLHLWLPKAHVEAPSVGSVILARVVLKIGVYGVIRIIMFWSYRHWAYMMYLWAILGVAGSSVLCLMLWDV